MISLTKEHLHEQNKKLTEENQRLELLVISLQRQLQNSAHLMEKSKKLEEHVEILLRELNNLRRDNIYLQELIHQSKGNAHETEYAQKQIETDLIKEQYEEKIKAYLNENKRLAKIVKDLHSKQRNSLEEQAVKLLEISNKIDQKLSDQVQTHRRIISNPSPKGISKEIYENLIQQLNNQSVDDKSIITDQTKSRLQDSQKFNSSAYKQLLANQTVSLPSLRKVIKK